MGRSIDFRTDPPDDIGGDIADDKGDKQDAEKRSEGINTQEKDTPNQDLFPGKPPDKLKCVSHLFCRVHGSSFPTGWRKPVLYDKGAKKIDVDCNENINPKGRECKSIRILPTKARASAPAGTIRIRRDISF